MKEFKERYPNYKFGYSKTMTEELVGYSLSRIEIIGKKDKVYQTFEIPVSYFSALTNFLEDKKFNYRIEMQLNDATLMICKTKERRILGFCKETKERVSIISEQIKEVEPWEMMIIEEMGGNWQG